MKKFIFVVFICESLALSLRMNTALATSCQELVSIDVNHTLPHLVLEDVIRQAVETHPSIVNSELNYESSLEDIRLARSRRFPQANLTLGFGETINPVSAPRNGNLFSHNFGVSLSWLLYDFGTTKNSVNAAQENSLSAEAGIAAQKNIVALSTIESYIDILEQRLALGITLEAYKDFKNIWLELKGSPFSDDESLNPVVARKDSLCSTARGFRQQEFKAYSYFESILDYEPRGYFLEEPPLPAIERSSAKALEVAQNQLPEYAIIRHQIASARNNVQSARADRFGTFSLKANSFDYEHDSRSLGNKDVQGGFVGIEYNLPLFDGHNRRSKVSKGTIALSQTELKEIELNRKVRRQLRDLVFAVETSEAKIAQLEIAVRAAEQTYLEMRKRLLVADRSGKMKLDRQNLLNMLNEREKWYKAQIDLNHQRFSLLLSAYNLHIAQGKLFPAGFE